MLIEPASKVSVPFTVVMRTRSRAPPSASEPPDTYIAPPDEVTVPVQTQVFVACSVNTKEPLIAVVEPHCELFTPIPKPVVKAACVVVPE